VSICIAAFAEDELVLLCRELRVMVKVRC
jgi:hypothetical protein